MHSVKGSKLREDIISVGRAVKSQIIAHGVKIWWRLYPSISPCCSDLILDPLFTRRCYYYSLISIVLWSAHGPSVSQFSLVFSEILHEGDGQWSKKNGTANILKKPYSEIKGDWVSKVGVL